MQLKARHRRFAWIAGAIVLLAIAAALVLNAFRSNLVFFYTPSQVFANEAPKGRNFRIGGLVEPGEDLEVCAHRELEEETHLTGLSLEQLHAFGAPNRDPRGRVVSVAYLTLVRADRLEPPRAGDDAADIRWFDIDDLPSLAFDHAEIIALARRRL